MHLQPVNLAADLMLDFIRALSIVNAARARTVLQKTHRCIINHCHGSDPPVLQGLREFAGFRQRRWRALRSYQTQDGAPNQCCSSTDNLQRSNTSGYLGLLALTSQIRRMCSSPSRCWRCARCDRCSCHRVRDQKLQQALGV